MSNSESEAKGDSPRLIVAAMMALVGAMFFVFVLEEDLQNFSQAEWSDLPPLLIGRYVLAMGCGGALAGWLLCGLFGRSGIVGWALAAIGGVLATLLTGLIGGALGRLPDLLADGWQTTDLVSIAAGLLIPIFAMAGQTLIAVAWVVLIALAHLLATRKRAQG